MKLLSISILFLLLIPVNVYSQCNCTCVDTSTETITSDRFTKDLNDNIKVRLPLSEMNGAFFYDMHLGEPLTGAYSEILAIKKTKDKLSFMNLNGGIITSTSGKGSLLTSITFKPGLLTKSIRSVLSPFGQALETGVFTSYDFRVHQLRYGMFLGLHVW
jgi:hypothetical protein